eukprot:2318407-Pyramimonas_sp.AAC.1
MLRAGGGKEAVTHAASSGSAGETVRARRHRRLCYHPRAALVPDRGRGYAPTRLSDSPRVDFEASTPPVGSNSRPDRRRSPHMARLETCARVRSRRGRPSICP